MRFTWNWRIWLTSTLLFAVIVGEASADVVLNIDLSDPSNITILSTSGLSSTNATLSIGGAGFTIENFFTAAVVYPSTTTFSGNLSPTLGTTDVYSGLGTFEFSDNDGLFKAGNDLSIYRAVGSGGDQVWNTSTAAFTGTASSIDFSSTIAELPGLGAMGNVYSGFQESGTADHGEIIGQWRVTATAVPEPSSLLFLGLFVGVSIACCWKRITVSSKE